MSKVVSLINPTLNKKIKVFMQLFIVIICIAVMPSYGYETIQAEIHEYEETFLPDVTEPGFDYSTLEDKSSNEEDAVNKLLMRSAIDDTSSKSSDGDNLSDLMSNGKAVKITADPNENIDLFSGILHLNYKDVSVPVVPGLNMELSRKYSSEIYEKISSKYDTGKGFNYAHNGWSINAGYIDDPICAPADPKCSAIYVDADGHRHVLMTEAIYSKDTYVRNDSQHYRIVRNKDNWKYIILAPNGYKLYFDLQIASHRQRDIYYLTRMETPDGKHFIEYHYEDILLTKITSSDPNKTIEIKYSDIDHSQHNFEGGKIHAVVPVAVYFNNKLMAEYGYELSSLKKDKYLTPLLKNVKLANGYKWNYNYDFFDLRVKHHKRIKGEDYTRSMLTSINHPDGEVTKYSYGIDYSLRYQEKMHLIRLDKRNHFGHNKIDSGEWQFKNLDGPIHNNNKTKLVKVIGPYNTADYYFNGYNSGSVWKLGLPDKVNIYRDHDDSESNIIQQEIYTWQAALQNYKRNYASLKHNDEIYDKNTFRPLLQSKTIIRDGESYKTEYSDFDDLDNPKKITQSNGKYKRIIKQDIENKQDKNIIGLVKSMSVDGKNIVKNDYDEFGRVVASEKLGKKTYITYQNGLVESSTDANGNVIQYKNYVGGVPSTVVYPDDSTEDYVVNKFSLIDIAYNKKGNPTKFEYDNFGRLIKETPAWGDGVNYEYGLYQKTTIHGDHEVHEQYNAYNQLISSAENNSIQVIAKYDALGRKIFQSYPHSNNNNSSELIGHKFDYDSLGRLLSDCYPVNNAQACIKYSYLTSNKVKVDYPNGEYAISSYKAYGDPDNGKLVKIEQDARTTHINRDHLDYITSIKQGDISKNYYYDAKYNLVKYTEPETGITEYSYDKVGNVLRKKNNNQYINFVYDHYNYNLLEKRYSDDSYSEYFDYDISGNVIATEKGRIKNSYKYNENDSLVNAKTIINIDGKPHVYDLKYNYNRVGQIDSIVYPDGSKIDYNPNSLGQATRVGKYIRNISYHDSKQWSRYNLGSGILASTGLDHALRINKFQFGSLVQNFDYDNNNNLVNYSISDSSQQHFNYKLSMSYDKTGRLISSQGPWGSMNYKYDANDNILMIDKLNNQTDINNSNEKLSFSYQNTRLDAVKSNNKTSARSEDYSYDLQGNIDRDNYNRYLYGADGNLLASMGLENASYEYDVNNNRVIRTLNNSDIYTIYDGSGVALYEINTKENKETKFIYFNGQRIAEEVKQNNKYNTFYFYNDQLGSPVAKTDSKGNILWRQLYKPFGDTYFEHDEKSNTRWFMGKEVGKNNLSYIGARYYNSNFGRFMSPDPVGVKPDIPATFNKYAYGANNPYKYVDSDGRFLQLITPASAFLFFVGGGLSSYPLWRDHHYVGAAVALFAGGVASAAAGPLAAEIASARALAYLGLEHSITIKAAAEIGINTLSLNIIDVASNRDVQTYKNFKTSMAGFAISKKLNPMDIKAETMPEVLLFTSNSTLMGKLYSLAGQYTEDHNSTSILNKINKIENDNNSNGLQMNMCEAKEIMISFQIPMG